LDLTIDETYSFDLFFAERHTISSAFTVTTTIVFDPQLKVIKTIDNDNGGSLGIENVTFAADDGNSPITLTHNSFVTVPGGTYNVTESFDASFGTYTATYGGDCNTSGSVTLLPGESKTCTILNEDDSAELTVVKQITNNDGGILQVSDVTLTLDTIGDVTSGTANTVNAGNHTATESFDASFGVYDLTFSGACDASGKTTLLPGDNKICTLNNADSNSTSLTIIKDITNDSGGNLQVSDVVLTLDTMKRN